MSRFQRRLLRWTGIEAAKREGPVPLLSWWALEQSGPSEFRNDMIRVANRAGVSIRQLADVSGLGRKAVTAIVTCQRAGLTERLAAHN